MNFQSSFRKIPCAVFISGLTLTMLAYVFVRDWEESGNLEEISYRSETRLIAIKNSFDFMVESTRHVRSFILNELTVEEKDEVTLDEFMINAKSYLSKRGKKSMQVMAWLPKMLHSEHKKMFEKMRAESGYPIAITNFSGKASQHESHDDAHYPLYYAVINPESGLNVGVDIASEPTYRVHLHDAMVSGVTVLHLQVDESGRHIVSLFVPVFKSENLVDKQFSDGSPVGGKSKEEQLLGFVFSQWDVGAILEEAVQHFPISGLDFFLDDDQGAHIYTHTSRSRSEGEASSRAQVVWQREFNVAEHVWSLNSAPSALFYEHHPIILAWAVLIFGVVVSAGCAFYVFLVSIRKEQVEKEVVLRTKELKQSQERLEETQSIAHLGGWEWNILTRELMWSDEVYRLFGYEPQSVESTFERLNAAVHPDDRERLEAAVKAAFKGENYSITHRIILPDGEVRFVHEQARIEYDDDKAIRMIGTVQDITDRHRTERSLHRLAMALAETAESVVITNKDGAIRYVNRAFENMSGYSAEEVLDKQPNLVKSDEHSPEYYELMWKKLLSGERWAGTFINRNKRGELYETEQTISPIRDAQNDVTGFVAVQRDVTEEKKRQAKMEHTQRLESLGVLAGGIAHDFNNLLTSILGNANLARRKQDSDGYKVNVHLDRIESASERAAELCRQMLAYSGQGDYMREWFSLNERVHGMSELLQVSMSKRVAFKMYLTPSKYLIYGDKSQIQQVVMNLVINASEAIDEATKGSSLSGIIQLSTEVIEMSEGGFDGCYYDKHETPKPGNYFCLTVSDDGCGMNAETRLKVFDPFFTTKFTGRGLGTSAMLGIVQSHGGALSLTTEEGKGTTFRVYLPCQEDMEPMEEVVLHKKDDTLALSQHNQTVLLVDDEKFILETASLMLGAMGCPVICSENATEAIQIYSEQYQDIDLIILDMTMPEMDGVSCAKALLQINPDALIMISSGYNQHVLEERTGDVNIAGYLQKPYSQNELMSLVDRLLDPS